MNEENAIGYYSIIPSTILYNNNLKPNQKLLYAIITSLSCKEGYCFASNKYLAEKLKVNPKTISNWISDLNSKGFIIVDIEKNENNQVIQRRIYINDTPYPLKNGYPSPSNNGKGIHQMMEYNNINKNNKGRNIYANKKRISPFSEQRHYTEEFLRSLYAN